jgi:hypothetical protein
MSNAIIDVLKDVLAHTQSLGMFELIKYKNTAGDATVYAYLPDQTFLLKAKIRKDIPELTDHTIGLSRMDILSSFVGYEDFNADGSAVDIISKTIAGTNIPSEIKFESPVGTTAGYRFTTAAVIEQNVQDFDFTGTTYQIVFAPSEKNIKDLQFFTGALGGYQTMFTPKTEGGNLYFYIGDDGSDRTKILIKTNVSGKLSHTNSWDLSTFIKLIKLSDSAAANVNISHDGIIEISVDSGIGVYTYYMAAKA